MAKKTRYQVKLDGDSVRLAEALLAVTTAVNGLPEKERADVLRAACIMYNVPVSRPAPERRVRR